MASRISTSLVVLVVAHAVQAAALLAAAPVLVVGLGLDGYGLIGIALLLLLLFGILDAGLSAAVTRRLAGEDPVAGAALLAGAERLQLAVAVAIVALGAILAWPLSGLLASTLPRAELAAGLALSVCAAAAQWPATLYHAGLNGRGRQVEGALIQAIGALLRWGGSAAIVLVGLADVRVVLLWYAVAAAAAAAALRARLRRGLPRVAASLAGTGAYARDVSGFALAVTGFTVIDRLAGTAILPLGAFGVYALVAQAAQMAGVLIATIRAIWFPRIAALLGRGDRAGARDALGDAVQVAALMVVPWSAVLALLPHVLLFAWTGSAEIAATGAVALAVLAAGWGTLGVGWAIATLDLARGTMQRATRLAAAHAAVLVILAPIGAWTGGVAGLGVAAGATVGAYALIYIAGPGTPLGAHARAVLRPLAVTSAAAAAPPLLAALLPLPAGRIAAGLVVWAAWLAGCAAAGLASATGRMALGVALDRLGLGRRQAS